MINAKFEENNYKDYVTEKVSNMMIMTGKWKKRQDMKRKRVRKWKHEKEVKDNPMRIIINALIEREEKGQLSPQTIEDLKMLLNAVEVSKEL